MSEFHYGGQAVIEGVMIRGQKNMAVAVRDPAGKIVVHADLYLHYGTTWNLKFVEPALEKCYFPNRTV